MKGLAALMMAGAFAVVLAGCHCPCENQDGLYDDMNDGYAAYPETMGQAAAEMNIMEPIPADVYAYVPPTAMETMEAPDEATAGDGVVDGVGDWPYDAVYEELMSVMDMEEIGTGSAFRIIR